MEELETTGIETAESVETADPVEPVEESPEETVEATAEETSEAPVEQSAEENHAYAEMRRKAEAAARAKYEREREAMNSRFSSIFGKYGVSSAEEYLDKYEAQQQEQVQNQIKEAGLDVDQITAMVQNTPEIRELRQTAAILKEQEAERRQEAALQEIKQLDPSITDWKDIAAQDADRKFYDLVFDKGLDEVSAYKIAFFDKMLKTRNEAAQQAAVNAARSKGHLDPIKGHGKPASAMSDEDMAEWKAYGFSESDANRFHNKYNQ